MFETCHGRAYTKWNGETYLQSERGMIMGAESRMDIIKGSTASEAYNNAVDQAAWEHGSGGYTGSIAESSGYKVASPRTLWEAERAADTLLNGGTIDGLRTQKWEYTVLIPLLEEEKVRTIDMAVDVTGVEEFARNEYGLHSGISNWAPAVHRAAREKARKGEHVMSVDWVSERKKSWYVGPLEGLFGLTKQVVKDVVVRTKGGQVTVWAVVGGSRPKSVVYLTTTDLDEAKREAVKLSGRMDGEDVGIVQMKVRDGDPDGFLYRARQEVAKNVLGARVVFGKSTGRPNGEFLAVGVYSS